jgi:hypothetical protein
MPVPDEQRDRYWNHHNFLMGSLQLDNQSLSFPSIVTVSSLDLRTLVSFTLAFALGRFDPDFHQDTA